MEQELLEEITDAPQISCTCIKGIRGRRPYDETARAERIAYNTKAKNSQLTCLVCRSSKKQKSVRLPKNSIRELPLYTGIYGLTIDEVEQLYHSIVLEFTIKNSETLSHRLPKIPNLWRNNNISNGINMNAHALLFAWKNKDRGFNKSEISKDYELFTGKKSQDYQNVRHLRGQSGFYILQKKEGDKTTNQTDYQLVDLIPAPEFNGLRISNSEQDFELLKASGDNRCGVANCRRKEGETGPDGRPVKLEKGHRNPTNPSLINNCMPQCSYCNQIFSHHRFDMHGMPYEL